MVRGFGDDGFRADALVSPVVAGYLQELADRAKKQFKEERKAKAEPAVTEPAPAGVPAAPATGQADQDEDDDDDDDDMSSGGTYDPEECGLLVGNGTVG
jgi:hypothetical protein